MVPPEAPYLTLSAERAHVRLGWRQKLGFDEAVAWTAKWYAARQAGAAMAAFTRGQIERYLAR